MANSHTTEQRAFIVYSLANCVDPETIVAQFAAQWKGVPCDISDIGACAPSRLKGDWRKYFDQERAIFLEAPLGDKDVRKAFLARLASAAAGNNQHGVAAKYLELLAKEDAGFFAAKAKGDDDKTPIFAEVTVKRTVVKPDA